MKIGVDIDDVVVEFSRAYLDFYNRIHGTNFKFKDIHSPKFEESLKTTRERAVKRVNDFYETDIFDNLELVEGIRELISQLSENHDLIFITARALKTREKTRFFLEKQFPGIPLNVFHTGDCFGEHKTKAEICGEQEVDFLIEDNHSFALSCAKKGVKVFLLEKPWNRNSEDHPNLIKITHLKEVLEQIK